MTGPEGRRLWKNESASHWSVELGALREQVEAS